MTDAHKVNIKKQGIELMVKCLDCIYVSLTLLSCMVFVTPLLSLKLHIEIQSALQCLLDEKIPKEGCASKIQPSENRYFLGPT